jgi:hypothetical protein
MMCFPDNSQKQLAEYLSPLYAQCWSFEGESDALLKAYSRVTKDNITKRNAEPKYEGVQVKTNPRKVIAALNAFLNKRKGLKLELYLGAVKYVPDPAQVITNWLNQLGPDKFSRSIYPVRSLLLKRKAFQHESEVRIILRSAALASSEPFNVEIDPNEVFEEVRFDSRLALFELRERKRLAEQLGYKGSMPETGGLYEGRLFEVHVDKNLNEYEK